MTLTVCPTCLSPQLKGHRCGSGAERGRARRRQRSIDKGADSRHWRRISALARVRDGGCVVCGCTEDLTVDYEGDHSKVLLDDTVTLCRAHHGRKDGAKRVEAVF